MVLSMSSPKQKIEILETYQKYDGKRNRMIATAQCFCGKTFETRLTSIKSGHTKSCGCLNITQIERDLKSHGMSYSPTYSSWKGAKQRCYNKNSKKYHIYGGKGIKVCDRWLNSFENFLEDMGERTIDQSLDRIDPNGNYEPSNCRWISKSENSSRGTVNRNLIYGNPFKKGRPK